MTTPGPKRTRPYYSTIKRYQTKSTQGVLQDGTFWDLAPGLPPQPPYYYYIYHSTRLGEVKVVYLDIKPHCFDAKHH